MKVQHVKDEKGEDALLSGARGLNEATSGKQAAKSMAPMHTLALVVQKEASGRVVASKDLAAQGNWEPLVHQEEGCGNICAAPLAAVETSS